MGRNYFLGDYVAVVLPSVAAGQAMHRIHFALKWLFREQLAEIIVATCASSLAGVTSLSCVKPARSRAGLGGVCLMRASMVIIQGLFWAKQKNADLRFANASRKAIPPLTHAHTIYRIYHNLVKHPS